jgi:hypothetical protein
MAGGVGALFWTAAAAAVVNTCAIDVLSRRCWFMAFIVHESVARFVAVVRTVEGEILLLTNVVRSDMGNYLCIATNGVPPSVSKRFAINIHCEYKNLLIYFSSVDELKCFNWPANAMCCLI